VGKGSTRLKKQTTHFLEISNLEKTKIQAGKYSSKMLILKAAGVKGL
jgi:hypothetical protein